MSVKDELEKALKSAMLSKDDNRRDVIRLALSSVKQVEKDSGKELTDTELFGVIQKEIKTREETIAEAEKAERNEMIPPLKTEIEMLMEFLPPEMTDKELEETVIAIVEELDASSMKDMGRVMKEAITRSAGSASNDRISRAVRKILQP